MFNFQEGWMSKTGPKRLEKFRRRWFTLVGNMIWYYTQPLDAHPLGYIPLGSRTFGYGVMKGLPQGIKSEGGALIGLVLKKINIIIDGGK